MPELRAAICARVSIFDQEPGHQLAELWRYGEALHWTAREDVESGVSGAKDRRPALDRLVADAKRRRFDMPVCWGLHRLGRNLTYLVGELVDLQAQDAPYSDKLGGRQGGRWQPPPPVGLATPT